VGLRQAWSCKGVRFDFSANTLPIDLDALAARFADPEIWRRSVQDKEGEEPES